MARAAGSRWVPAEAKGGQAAGEGRRRGKVSICAGRRGSVSVGGSAKGEAKGEAASRPRTRRLASWPAFALHFSFSGYLVQAITIFQKRHYYSSYSKFVTAILHLPHLCHFLHLTRTRAHLQASYRDQITLRPSRCRPVSLLLRRPRSPHAQRPPHLRPAVLPDLPHRPGSFPSTTPGGGRTCASPPSMGGKSRRRGGANPDDETTFSSARSVGAAGAQVLRRPAPPPRAPRPCLLGPSPEDAPRRRQLQGHCARAQGHGERCQGDAPQPVRQVWVPRRLRPGADRCSVLFLCKLNLIIRRFENGTNQLLPWFVCQRMRGTRAGCRQGRTYCGRCGGSWTALTAAIRRCFTFPNYG
jgi:hypothetical protein